MAPSSFQPRRTRSGKYAPDQGKPRLSLALPSIFCCRPFKEKVDITFNSEQVDRSFKEDSPPSSEGECGNTAMSGPVRAEPYHWPHDGRLESATTALVIIDMQRDFCEDGGYMAYQGYDITPAKNVIPVIKSLLVKFREAGYPIYFTREGHRPDLSTLSTREHYRSRNNAEHLGIGDKGPLGRLLIRGEKGHNIVDELRPLENEPIIDKPGRGAFAHTEFGLMLSIKGIKNLIICGVTTDVCVTSTLREANDRRFDCILVSDACAAGEVALHDAAIQTIKEEGGIFGTVTTSEELLHALRETRYPGPLTDSHSEPAPPPTQNSSIIHTSVPVDEPGNGIEDGVRATDALDETERVQLLDRSAEMPPALPPPPETSQKMVASHYLNLHKPLAANSATSGDVKEAPSSARVFKKRSFIALPWKAALGRFATGSNDHCHHDRTGRATA